MSRILSIAIIVVFACTIPCYAGGGTTTQPAGEGIAIIYGGGGSTNNYYDLQSTLKAFDTLDTRFTALSFGLSLDYGITDFLEGNLELPIGYFAVSSSSRFPDRSIFAPAYYGVGVTYQLLKERIHMTVSTMLKIPPGFHNGIYDNPKHPSFLSDGYMQHTTKLNVGFHQDDLWVKFSGGYNWRDEEPADELLFSAEFGSSKVEGSGIYLGVNGVVSTEDVTKPLRAFYAGAAGSVEDQQRPDGGRGRFSSIDRESYIAISPGAYVYLMDDLLVSGSYSIRIAGTNSLAIQGAYLAFGYHL